MKLHDTFGRNGSYLAGPAFPVQHGGFMCFGSRLKRGHRRGRGRFVSAVDSLRQAARSGRSHAAQTPLRPRAAGRGSAERPSLRDGSGSHTANYSSLLRPRGRCVHNVSALYVACVRVAGARLWPRRAPGRTKAALTTPGENICTLIRDCCFPDGSVEKL